MTFTKGQRVLTPHPRVLTPDEVEGVYEGDVEDAVLGPTFESFSERVPQGAVKYGDGSRRVWPLDDIKPIA